MSPAEQENKQVIFINPESTKVILIGVSEFEDKAFINAPPIKNNVQRLYELLQDERIAGIPKENILLLNNNERHDDILLKIDEFLSEPVDTVIFYFAGHGYKDTRDGKFYLVAHNTRRNIIHRTGIAWDDIKDMLERGRGIQQRLYILDACHSGAATLGDDDQDLDLAEGSALLAAAKADSKAYFDTSEKFTYFSGALINLLEQGIKKEDLPGLNVSMIYDYLNKKLKSKKFDITQKITDTIVQVNFFKNVKYNSELEKIKEIKEDLKWVDQLLENREYKRAETFLKGLRQKATQLSSAKRLISEIDRKLEDCKFLPRYYNFFEEVFKDRLKQKDIEIHKAKKDIEKLKQEKQELENKIKEVQNKYEQLLVDKANIEQELKNRKTTIDELTRNLEILDKEKNSLLKEIEEKQKTINKLRAELDKLKEIKLVAKPVSQVEGKPKSYIEKAAGVDMEFVIIEGGSFAMGSPDGEGKDNEHPQHTVIVRSFYISKYEVTFSQYDKFCEETGRSKPGDWGWGRGNRPVIEVSWYDAVEFCNWLSRKAGLEPYYNIKVKGKKVTIKPDANGYRLPTEAEWEYAARGGNKSRGYKYAGSDNIDEVAWYKRNSGGKTHPVGQKKPNELGLYDMSGNVWEWCWDRYDSGYYSRSPKENPLGPNSKYNRVLRGGSWSDGASYCRVAYRSYSATSIHGPDIGFRLTRNE